MITRRTALGLMAGAFAILAVPGLSGQAFAAGRVRFDRAAFDAALKTGKPVLIDISASWCPTCQRQKQILADLTKQPQFAAYTIFEVDYDTEKDIMRSFGAQQRSTLIAFKNGSETGRVVGDTRVASIQALLAAAI
jgi:thioredoxin